MTTPIRCSMCNGDLHAAGSPGACRYDHLPEEAHRAKWVDRSVVLDTPEQINTFALSVAARAARMKADGGMQLTSRMPSLKRLCATWGIEAKTWKQAADKLEELLAAQKREMGIGS
jgi:uncharacterized membrane protein